MSESGCNQKNNCICNLEYLLVNLGRNQAAAERLIHIFLDNAPTLCLRLEDAAMKVDLPALKDVLHDIRSSCVLFSGQLCVDQARYIEQVIREHLLETPVSNPATDWRSMSESLIVCIQCMASELKAYLDTKRG